MSKKEPDFETACGPLLQYGTLTEAQLASLRTILHDLAIGPAVRIQRLGWSNEAITLLLIPEPLVAGYLAASLQDGTLRSFGAHFTPRHGFEFLARVKTVRSLLVGKSVRISGGHCQGHSGVCTAVAMSPGDDRISIVFNNGSSYSLAIDEIGSDYCVGRTDTFSGFNRRVELAEVENQQAHSA